MAPPVDASPTAANAKLNRKVIAISIGAALGGFLFGFDSSVVNGAVDAIQKGFSLGSAVTGFAVASALLGCAVGDCAKNLWANRRSTWRFHPSPRSPPWRGCLAPRR